LLTITQARSRRETFDWLTTVRPAPTFLGVRAFDDYPLTELVECIDWTPFFQTWELKGRYPDIFDHPDYGKQARDVFDDARRLLDRIVAEKLLTARAVVGFYPAASVGDDVDLYTDESRDGLLATFHFLRQQADKSAQRPDNCLADFVAPRDAGVNDHIGLFAVTAGIGLEKLVSEFDKQNDDYQSIMAKALADRLAEAFAERMHERVRKELWGYAAHEALTNDDLVAEKYEGIRPAPGYPACPDHTEKRQLFDILKAEERAGITLTESFAMWPAASVSGFYFAHPKSHYFGVGRIGKDQVEDYARRRGMSLSEAERWLSPSLGYAPGA
jgi:5-methyltetrahydrofolate--homocysteine methyltransferase